MKNFIVESDFTYRDYYCVIVFSSLGYRCGYVALPENHPLYGKKIRDKVKYLNKDMLDKDPGKRSPIQVLLHTSEMQENPDDEVTLGFFFNVHGGITYAESGNNNYPVPKENVWWIGFDCGHSSDKIDIESLERLWGNDSEEVKSVISIEKHIKAHSSFWSKTVIRTTDFVRSELEDLVDQIIDYTENCDKM